VQCIALSVLQWRHYRRIGGIGCFGEDAVSRALAVCVGMPVSTFRSLQTDSRDSLAGTRQLSAYSWYRSFSTNGAASVLPVRAATSCCKVVQAMTTETCGVRNSARILTRRQKGGSLEGHGQGVLCASRRSATSVLLRGSTWPSLLPPCWNRCRCPTSTVAAGASGRQSGGRAPGEDAVQCSALSVLQLRHHCRDACTGWLGADVVGRMMPFANAHAGVC